MSIKYFIYARKSTEAEDKQVSSIEDQLAEVQRIAKANGLDVVDVISEAKSAKVPGRKAFNLMLKRIQKGEAQGILCWKLNRLARNPVDGGSISMMLQQGVIQHVQTYERSYYPSDNVLMMLIEFGMANQFVKDLSIDVRRGMARKAERGWYPSKSLPVGYKHNPERNMNPNQPEILCDEKSFKKVKHLWKLLLTGNYNIVELKKIGDAMELRNIKGRKISLTAYRRIFDSTFYCGYFKWRGLDGEIQEYKGKHKTMITRREFEKVQKILSGRYILPREDIKASPFKGLFICGECECSMTREEVDRAYCLDCKVKFSVKKTSHCPDCKRCISEVSEFTFLHKVYFRCTKKSKYKKCAQPYLLENEMKQEIEKKINNMSIGQEFYRWVLQVLPKVNFEDPNKKLKENLQKELNTIRETLRGYTDMRARGEISADDFRERKLEFDKQIYELEKQVRNLTTIIADVKKELRDEIELLYHLEKKYQKVLKQQDGEGLRRILRQFGSNPTIIQKTLCFSREYLLTSWSKMEKLYLGYKARLEPKKSVINSHDLNENNPVFTEFSALCTGRCLARTQKE